jgi:hypothetical protein
MMKIKNTEINGQFLEQNGRLHFPEMQIRATAASSEHDGYRASISPHLNVITSPS